MTQTVPATDCCAPTGTDLPTDTADDLAATFKALGDPIRLRLLHMIAARRGDEICVCELTPAFGVSGPTISHHLKALRTAGLVESQRRGTWVYYRVVPDRLRRLTGLLTDCLPPSPPDHVQR